MAWNGYNNNQGGNAQSIGRDYAVDWEAKSIPLLAYKNCLACKEEYLLSIKGTPTQHQLVTKNKFIVSLITFYDTVESGFITDLNKWAKKKETAVIFDNKEITELDYRVLLGDTSGVSPTKLFLLFRTLKNWSFEFGPFRTFAEHDEDIFKELEEQE
jgi:hypothetical protein